MPDSPATPSPARFQRLRHPGMVGGLAIALAVAEVLVDVSTKIQLNVAIVYSLPLVLAAAARNRRLLWGLAFVLVSITFIAYWQQSDVHALHDEYFINRVLAAVSVLLAAALLHALIVAAETLEARNRQLSIYQQEITQRNRELDLQRAEAEDASERKTRLLMSISHDIRSPLTSITLMADLIADSVPDPARQARLPGLAQNLQRDALSLADMVNDVLDIAYFDSGRIELRESEFSLNELVAEECRALEPLAAAKNLVLATELSPCAIWLRADRIKLGRVLRNLVNNALQFTERGGVTVASGPAPEGGVLMRVSDTGPGIAPESLQSVFGEFTQLSLRRSGERPGWGLGLAICRRLTRLMGGEVTVESEPGRGSSFIVNLPPSRVVPRSQPI
jgi:signal transduction histidine kinase